MLAPYVEEFRCRLLSLGYTPGSVCNELAVLGHLGRWMSERGIAVDQLSGVQIDAFVAESRREGVRQRVFRSCLLVLREQLIEAGAVPPDPPVDACPVDDMVACYRGWLLGERGLAEATVRRYASTARRFLAQRPGGVEVADLTGTEVSAFLLAETAWCSVGAAKGRVAELLALLRWLFVTGRIPDALAGAVPPVAGWHDTGIAPTLSAGTIQALLDSCDRGSQVGVRDFAILMLLARLALRSIEIARLQLADVHWRAGEITIRGKARRLDRLPLSGEVGEALVSYLVDARPTSESRQLFLTCRAPRRPITAYAVSDVVQGACVRAGVPVVGPHRLRHAVATGLAAHGVALSDISQVLRHRDLATTASYAKVDLDSLRMVARPWPAVQLGAQR